ncbi:thermonuclease family protein [Niveibacterium sp. SC-1]|uniref:thermonuclease family protein n=1 Tax=Niveibacterium sp. SC-1 TaxID=3135646 RepID=UPI00311D4D99
MAALLVLAFLCAPASAKDGRFQAQLAYVDDGDTLHVRDLGGRMRVVRLAFIDAPEHGQPHGDAARAALKHFVSAGWLTVDWRGRDKYGRYVAVVWASSPDMSCAGRRDCPRNLDVAHALVAGGHAWWYRRYARDSQAPAAQAAFEYDESEARRRGIGLWQDPEAVPPWAWRRSHPRHAD